MFWDPEEKKLVWFHLPDDAAALDVVASGEALEKFDDAPRNCDGCSTKTFRNLQE